MMFFPNFPERSAFQDIFDGNFYLDTKIQFPFSQTNWEGSESSL